jgi:hypothetical protein
MIVLAYRDDPNGMFASLVKLDELAVERLRDRAALHA